MILLSTATLAYKFWGVNEGVNNSRIIPITYVLSCIIVHYVMRDKMSLSDEELLFDNNQYVRMYGAVDDSNITSSGTFISSGSFEVRNPPAS